jgi:flavin reductase (DIM6/NTAB) family NADH-FMN oxidoreductase RutF
MGAQGDRLFKFGLTQVPATLIAAPLMGACYAKLECRVVDARLKNRYNFFVLEVVRAWVEPICQMPCTPRHRDHGVVMVASDTMKLSSRME